LACQKEELSSDELPDCAKEFEKWRKNYMKPTGQVGVFHVQQMRDAWNACWELRDSLDGVQYE